MCMFFGVLMLKRKTHIISPHPPIFFVTDDVFTLSVSKFLIIFITNKNHIYGVVW